MVANCSDDGARLHPLTSSIALYSARLVAGHEIVLTGIVIIFPEDVSSIWMGFQESRSK